MSDESVDSTPVAVIRRRRAQPFFGRHPWVFAGAIERIDSAAEEVPSAGTLIQVRSYEGECIGWGLFNPDSNIRIRMYCWNESCPNLEDLFGERIRTAVDVRKACFDLGRSGMGCRLIFSEGDQLSGLTADWYDGWLLVQFTSRALYEYREMIVNQLQNELQPRGVWLRTEKGMREAEGLEVTDGLVAGQEPPRPLFLTDADLQFGVDVQQGQKTGFYLDQRNSRQAVAKYTRGHRVLDAFCFSGGFGIASVRTGGAVRSIGIDSSQSALDLAAANAELNGVGDRCEFRQGDVKVMLKELAEQGARYETVILDPPRMARTRGGIDRALRGYIKLNLQALQVLSPGGILVTCSCSGLVSRQQFLGVVAEVSRQSGRHIRILETLGQPSDHPVSAVCPETEYLKVCICRVD